jgi:predicted ferric reductase
MSADILALGLPRLVDFNSHPWWYLGRAGGFVAYGVLLVSVLLGASVSSRLFDGLLNRAWVYELHKFLSLFLILAVLFHALIMLPDPYAKFTVKQLLVPFQSHFKPIPTTVGIFALYGIVLIGLSFYVTRLIGQRAWRLLHYLTFLIFVGGTAHAIWTGTDSQTLGARLFFVTSFLGVLFLIFYRTLASRSQQKRATAAGVSALKRTIPTVS